MHSAFGVDHGEISKAKPPKGITGVAGRLTRAQRSTAGQGPSVPGSQRGIRGALNRAGEADISIKGIGSGLGTGAGATGRFMQRHPGLTGTAAVGGGGAAGYKLLSDKEPRRKKKAQ